MNTKQKVLLGLAGLTALAVAGGSVGTMAWFYSNTTVTASGLSMSINAPTDKIQISKDGTNWSSSISWTGTTSLSPCIAAWSDDESYRVLSLDSSDDSLAYTEAGDDDHVRFFVPKSNNPIDASGNVSQTLGWEQAGTSSPTYFDIVAELTPSSITEKTTGYILAKTIKVKTTFTTDNHTYSFKPVYTFSSQKTIFKSLRSMVILPGDAGQTGVGGRYAWHDYTNVSAFTNGCRASSNVVTFTFVSWFDGNSQYCKTANAVTDTITVSLEVSYAG